MYCDQFVCLCVCLCASISLEPPDQSSRNVLCRSPVAVAWSSWRRCDTLCTSDFMDDVTFGRVGRMATSGVAMYPGRSLMSMNALLLRPDRGTEYCDQFICRSVCLCVCVCLQTYIWNRFTHLHEIFVQIPCGRGSVLLWRHCDTLCTSGFMDDVTFGRSAPYGDAWKAEPLTYYH